MWRMMWEMLSTDDACIVGFGGMMSVVLVACQEFALTVLGSKTESMRLSSVSSSELTALGRHVPENIGRDSTID